ncbi:MAG: peptidylprolyl isomerase [Bacteroidia bacterium]|nr:peptidylprolyl isomerase [Bacteroidia bacterium]
MKRVQLLITALLLFAYTLSFSQPKGGSKKDKLVYLKTDFGEMVILLYDCTPLHKKNFLKLAESGFYNGTTFHRVIKGFMIQGGDPNSKDNDPNNDGQGGPGYTIPAEIIDTLKHVKGMVAAARLGDQVNPKRESSGSQFYIVQNDGGTPHLNGSYTIFGKVIQGIEVVDKIADQKTGTADRPLTNIPMTMKVVEMPKKKINKLYGLNLKWK